MVIEVVDKCLEEAVMDALQAENHQKLRTSLQKARKRLKEKKMVLLQLLRLRKRQVRRKLKRKEGVVTAERCLVTVVIVVWGAATILTAVGHHDAPDSRVRLVADLEYSHLLRYATSENVSVRGKENANCEKRTDVGEMKF